MKLLLLLIICLLFYISSNAQLLSWFHGDWTGETYFPKGPITKRIIVKLKVINITGNRFEAVVDNFYPNDTTVRLERKITGHIIDKNMRIESSEQIYIRDPRTQNFWHDCTGCEIESNFSINSNQIEIKLKTTHCSDECNGETTFSRDTSDLNPDQQKDLAKWLDLPALKPAAEKGKTPGKDSSSATLNQSSSVTKTDTLQKEKVTATNTKSIVPNAQVEQDSFAKRSTPETDSLPAALTTRNTNLVNTYKVLSPHIIIQLFDNAEIDGDVVTVYHNGQLIVNRQSLTHKAITITIDASKANAHHEFIMVADNLGLIPPNTALMRITAGEQKFELEVSSDFDNNSKITIDYTGE